MLVESLESRQMMSAVTGLVLVNADTGQDIMPLTSNAVLNLATLPTRNLNVRADVTYDTRSVKFGWDNDTEFHLENIKPFALMGDEDEGYNAWTPALGDQTITARAFRWTDARGRRGPTLTVKFTVIDSDSTAPSGDPQTPTTPTPPTLPATAVTRLVLVDVETGQDLTVLQDGATIDRSAYGNHDLTIRADTSNGTRSVRFALDGDSDYHVENYAPYALGGDNQAGRYYDSTLSTGAHDIKATAYSLAAGGGVAGAAVSAHFTIVNGTSAPTKPTPPTNPNPPTPPTGGGTGGGTTTPVPPTNPNPPTPPTGGGTGSGTTTPTPPTSNPGSAPALPGNWHIAFAEEFNTMPDPNLWTSSLWGMTKWTEEAQNYNSSAVSVNNGILNLTATKQSQNGKPYVSGLISTGGNGDAAYAFKYGYVEARMKLPAGKGLWPAFWMLPDANGGNYHDGDGEIDIMEVLGDAIGTHEAHLHVHGKTYGKAYDTGVDLSKDFHVYGLDWQADHLTFYFDGKEILRVTDTASIPNVPEYLILNLAVGGEGSWPGVPNAATQFPASLQVDYVHVWQK